MTLFWEAKDSLEHGGRHLVTEYGGQVAESNTTAGRKDGIDVTRLTLLYRKPGYDIGDVLRWRDHYWRPIDLDQRWSNYEPNRSTRTHGRKLA